MSLSWFKQYRALWQQWKNQTSTHLVGLDIGAHSIKLLELQPQPPHLIKHFAIKPLPPGAIHKGEIKDIASINHSLKELFHEQNISTKNIALAIPQLATIVKNFTVNNQLTQDEIESRTWIEANHYFPDLINDIYLDFQVMGPSQKDPAQLEVMIVACRKEQIDPYLNALKNQHLNPVIVDVDCYVLHRALSALYPSADKIILLNLDLNLMTLIMSEDHKLTQIHQQPLQGQSLLNEIETYFTKKSTALDENNEIDPAYLKILTAELGPHLRQIIHFFNVSRQTSPVQKIILSGDLAIKPAIERYIQQETRVATELANPFKDKTFLATPDATRLKEQAPAMMLSFGLSLSKPLHGENHDTN